jgi:alpha-L-rhamnosidase
MRRIIFSSLLIFALVVRSDELEKLFQQPSVDAKPAIWWYWGESVVTEHGITQDLEALKRAGFGGVVLYEQVFTDRPGALKSLSPEWLARLQFAAAECARLGLTLEVNVSDGYVAGGPWITPEIGMQRLVASETVVDGGKKISVPLSQPPPVLNFYRDVAVLAYPTPAGGGKSFSPKPKITSTPAGIDLKALFSTDGKSKAKISPPKNGEPVFIELDYSQPFTARNLTYSSRSSLKALVIATQVPDSWADDFLGQGMKPIPPLGELQASDDGRIWRTVCSVPAFGYQHDSWTQRTVAFPATTARFFRLKLDVPRDGLSIGGVALQSEARIDQWESKSGNVVDFSNPDRTPNFSDNEVIDPEKILDLTDKLSADGKLNWDAPPGRWTILRLGHTPTGARTKHGRPENLGLECDKLSAAATTVQFSNYVGVILREVRKVPGAKLAGVNIDSAEHGSQNWTADFEAQFEKLRGYSPRKYLPAMLGRVVGSRELSDKFLFDVRRTIADLMSDKYFGTFQKLCHAEGMTSMAEAPGIATCLPSDNIQAKGRTDIPMGEFWLSQPNGNMDCKETASAAHVYGLPVAAAEAFTGSGSDAHPALLKPFADAALAAGINRFVVLGYVHQPWDDKLPGVTQERFYVPFQRHNTWWNYSAPFWTSLARGSQLMREGEHIADILYHLGNDTPLKIATARLRPAPPAGYDYDVCGDEVLIQRAGVKDGRIVLPDGMSYRLLVLAGGEKLTLTAARKIKELVQAGACVLGPIKPIGSPSLADGNNGDAEVKKIADELWGENSPVNKGEKQTGAGRMFWGMSPAEVLAALDTPRDWEIGDRGAAAASPVSFLCAHRRAADADIYFVANHQPRAAKMSVAFRVTGRQPERWDADTGAFSKITGAHKVGCRTEIPLALEAEASTFIVFRDSIKSVAGKIAETNLVCDMPVKLELTGSWNVRFTPGWGAPKEATFAKLISWTEAVDDGIRHYSGTATYTKDFDLPALHSGERVTLDLGKVCVLASVKLNGRDLGIVWREPFALDATDTLRAGKNQLEIRVVNLWANRLIADSVLPPERRLTWVTWNPFHANDALLPSGLLGPVQIREVR